MKTLLSLFFLLLPLFAELPKQYSTKHTNYHYDLTPHSAFTLFEYAPMGAAFYENNLSFVGSEINLGIAYQYKSYTSNLHTLYLQTSLFSYLRRGELLHLDNHLQYYYQEAGASLAYQYQWRKKALFLELGVESTLLGNMPNLDTHYDSFNSLETLIEAFRWQAQFRLAY